jgi:hypothetical protein
LDHALMLSTATVGAIALEIRIAQLGPVERKVSG